MGEDIFGAIEIVGVKEEKEKEMTRKALTTYQIYACL